MAYLTRAHREILTELGIDVHLVENGVVHLGDQASGPYEPVSVEALIEACDAVDDPRRFLDSAHRFGVFHDVLAAFEPKEAISHTDIPFSEVLAVGMFAQDVVPPDQAFARFRALPVDVQGRWHERAQALINAYEA